jgi:hypothetical protein
MNFSRYSGAPQSLKTDLVILILIIWLCSAAVSDVETVVLNCPLMLLNNQSMISGMTKVTPKTDQ